jgi:hypothetical protein
LYLHDYPCEGEIKSCEEPGIYAIAYWMMQHCDIYENSVVYPYSSINYTIWNNSINLFYLEKSRSIVLVFTKDYIFRPYPVFHTFRVADKGHWLVWCRFVNGYDIVIIHAYIDVFVAAPYDISIQPAYIVIEMGSAIEATCMTKGDPVSTFAWYFKDQIVGTAPQLNIPESISMDDGLYTCIATNPFGILQDTVNVNVRCKYNLKIHGYVQSTCVIFFY